MTSTESRLIALIAAKLRVDAAQISLDQSLLDDLGLDSFDVMSLILEIEREFSPITLSDKAADELRTLRDVSDYLDRERQRLGL